jgi:hypothetical protein
MYKVIDCLRGDRIDSEWTDFDDALDRAEKLAKEQAREQAKDGEVPVAVSSYESGTRHDDGSGNWEAGACPWEDEGVHWPHVTWRED